MTSLHAALAFVALGGVLILLVAAGLTAAGVVRGRLWLDRAILVQALTAVVAAVVGLVVLTTRPPADPLHLLYGALLIGAALAVRATLASRSSERLGRWMTVVSVVLVGIFVRAVMTGG
jgi:hypothetical protein